jgi:OmpA-OmpF porin, OOP family
MKYFLFLTFLFCFNFSFCQTKKHILRYPNNSIAGKGKIITCSNKKYPCYQSPCKKIGKWHYYYRNGITERIENYKKIKDCNSNEIPDGIWQYFNEQGFLFKQEEYRNGVLWTADISKYYYNDKLGGEIQVRNGIKDTIKYVKTDSLNFIKNGNFCLYFAPPQLVINDGQNQIESQIPFWISPDGNTPDYYNQYRRLRGVRDNLNHDFNAMYNYVGIILYHEPTGYYSEYITGELNSQLTPNRKYCLKIRLRLIQNSGFYINQVGAYFSDSVPFLTNTTEKQKAFPQILFNQILDNKDEWSTLCALYTASGFEKYITLGRFSSLLETTINKINPLYRSAGDYNQSAYYLIDNIELHEDPTQCNCLNEKNNEISDRISFDLFNPADSTEWNANKTFVLRNIFFDFDKSDLLPNSFNELEKLFTLLKPGKISITISGHTDNIGSEEYNKALSLSRAKAVSDWLIAKGIDKTRIQIEGCGAKMPIVENNSDENRAINRRVEFKIIKP